MHALIASVKAASSRVAGSRTLGNSSCDKYCSPAQLFSRNRAVQEASALSAPPWSTARRPVSTTNTRNIGMFRKSKMAKRLRAPFPRLLSRESPTGTLRASFRGGVRDRGRGSFVSLMFEAYCAGNEDFATLSHSQLFDHEKVE